MSYPYGSHNFEECIKCGEAPAVDELGYCGHCHWVVRAEVEEGIYHLEKYLDAWAKFRSWEESHRHVHLLR